jgi:uncharacterized protein (UPF0276 family)
LGFGLGLRSAHYTTILEDNPAIDWFEIISENYLGTGGRRMYLLDQVRERYPIVLHGVSMSIGSVDPIDYEYLARLKDLAERVQAPWLSDHLCWTGVAGKNVHDLLPMVYNAETLHHTATRVRQITEFLERPLVIENPSVYIEFAESDMTEWDFMTQLAIEADCGFLLDVNNIYVSAYNHGFDPNVYVDAIPVDRIVQFHLAGHTNKGSHIIDTHSDHVIDPVWQLYERAVARTGMRASMVEWDEDIPEFPVLVAEIMKAKNLYQQVMAPPLQLIA